MMYRLLVSDYNEAFFGGDGIKKLREAIKNGKFTRDR